MAAKVLVVDDNQQKLAHIIRILTDAGYSRDDIDIAQTGADARRYVIDVKYDLLVLDIALPMRAEDSPDRRGGVRLLEEIIERDRYKRPSHVIGLTGHDDLLDEFGELFHANLWTLEQFHGSANGWADRLRAKALYILKASQTHTTSNFETDLCVITGLHSPELTQLRSLHWDWSAAEALDESTFVYRGRYTATGKQCSVIAAAAPRMGMVSSALLSMKMIQRFKPKLLVMVGICAGVKGECEIGDVILADPAWDWQMGKHKDNEFAFAPDQIGVAPEITARLIQMSEDRSVLFKIHEEFKAGTKPKNIPSIRVGPVASGSSVLSAEQVVSQIRYQHRKLLGIEMELYGVYAAARDSAYPKPLAFGLKCVSDFADSSKADDFQAYCAHVSANVLAHFCETYGSMFSCS